MNSSAWLATLVRPLRLILIASIAGAVVSAGGLQGDASYWLSSVSGSTRSAIAVAPLVAGWCAFFGGRVRMSRLSMHEHVQRRSRFAVFSATTIPVVIAAFGGVLVVLALRVREVTGYPGWAAFGLLGLTLLVLLAHGSIGHVLGIIFPRVVAVPLAALSSYLWLAFPRAFEPFWIRNINGEIGSRCCDIDATLGPGALSAPALFNIALIGAALLLACSRAWLRVLPVSLVLIVVGTLAGRSAAANLGPDPIAYRTSGFICDSTTSVRVCWWPEHASQARKELAPVLAAADQLFAAGFVAPAAITEVGGGDDSWVISFVPQAQPPAERLIGAESARVTVECRSMNSRQLSALEALESYGHATLDGTSIEVFQDGLDLQSLGIARSASGADLLDQLERVVQGCKK